MKKEAASAEELEFNALRNALYHTARRQRLEFWSRLFSLLVILGGTGSVISIANDLDATTWLGFGVAVVGALQLVFDFSGRASQHEILQRRFYDILSQLHAAEELSEDRRRVLMAELMRTYGDEPPTMRALDAVAYNEAVDALQGDAGAENRLEVNWWQYVTRHFLSHNGTNFGPKAHT